MGTTFLWSINFPGAKMPLMDILEFTDINGPAPKSEKWTNKAELAPAAHF